MDMHAEMLYVPQERVHETIMEYSKFSVTAKSPVWQQLVFFLRKLRRTKYENEQKSAVGNIWRQGTWVDQRRGPVSLTRAYVRGQVQKSDRIKSDRIQQWELFLFKWAISVDPVRLMYLCHARRQWELLALQLHLWSWKANRGTLSS